MGRVYSSKEEISGKGEILFDLVCGGAGTIAQWHGCGTYVTSGSLEVELCDGAR